VSDCAPFAQEGIVIRRHFIGVRFSLGIAAALLVAAQICPVARSQDPPPTQATTQSQTAPPPSLGDLARKYREEKATQDKNQATPKNTFTNDGLVSGKSGSLLGSGVSDVTTTHSTGNAFADAMARMDDAAKKLDLLGTLDHANLFNLALQGISVDFPGRKIWEEQLVVARQNYVVHGKELIRNTQALMQDAKNLHDAQPNLPPSDPRVQSFVTKLKANMSAADKLEGDFQAVVEEGHTRAMQASGH
jgi:hypothetical protein